MASKYETWRRKLTSLQNRRDKARRDGKTKAADALQKRIYAHWKKKPAEYDQRAASEMRAMKRRY